ncbi:MAG: DNA polymerase III subunit delta [Brachymonas sp.]|nr:DNA polymerase III subunit delta [Brachymonas sp.]
MQIKPEQLAGHVQKGLHSLYVLHGNEPLLVQEAADAIRTGARQQGAAERSSHTVSGAHFDWSGVLAASNSLSLFAERQLVEIHIPTGKPGKEGATALAQLAQSAAGNDATVLLVTLPRLDKAGKTSNWFTALEQHGVSVAIEGVERQALPRWIASRLRQQDQHVASGEEGEHALRFFADRVEGNLLAAHQEIQKLALLYPAGELSAAQIEAAVLNVARYDVFKLSEAVLSGQVQRVQRVLDGLQAEGESEVMVHYQLAEDIRALKRVREALDGGKPLPLALREQRVWGPRERLFERALPRLQAPVLVRLLHAAHLVDGITKGIKAEGWPADAWQALHRLAHALCQRVREPAPATGSRR